MRVITNFEIQKFLHAKSFLIILKDVDKKNGFGKFYKTCRNCDYGLLAKQISEETIHTHFCSLIKKKKSKHRRDENFYADQSG